MYAAYSVYVLVHSNQDYDLDCDVYYSLEEAQKAMREFYEAMIQLYNVSQEDLEENCFINEYSARVDADIEVYNWQIQEQEIVIANLEKSVKD